MKIVAATLATITIEAICGIYSRLMNQ